MSFASYELRRQSRIMVESSEQRRDAAEPAAERVRTPAGFGRKSRLLKHADFERVYKQGKRVFSHNLTLFVLARPDGAARVGLTVGKALGGAVERNRIKRRMREAVRLNVALLSISADVVINPKKPVAGMIFTELVTEVANALHKAARVVQPSGSR